MIPDAINALSENVSSGNDKIYAQMILVIRNLTFEQLITAGLPVVRELQKMDDVGLLLLDHVPTMVDNVADTQRVVVLLPSRAVDHRICVWQRYELELRRLAESVLVQYVLSDLLFLGIFFPFNVAAGGGEKVREEHMKFLDLTHPSQPGFSS